MRDASCGSMLFIPSRFTYYPANSMEITDEGYLLSLRRFGETSGIAVLCTAQHGIMRGLVKGAAGKRQRGALQPGNKLSLHWRARLNEQLGNLQLELMEPHAAYLLPNALALAALNAACALLETYLMEREAHSALYECLRLMIEAAAEGKPGWAAAYVRLEMQLLADAGFGLDLGKCALTGVWEGLSHVSPKSGRVVCTEAAQPYIEKLLPLPEFLRKNMDLNASTEPEALLSGLRLTGHFLHEWLVEASHRPLPEARARLIDAVRVTVPA